MGRFQPKGQVTERMIPMELLDTKSLMKHLHIGTREELLQYMFDPAHQGERIVKEFLVLLAYFKGGGEAHEKA